MLRAVIREALRRLPLYWGFSFALACTVAGRDSDEIEPQPCPDCRSVHYVYPYRAQYVKPSRLLDALLAFEAIAARRYRFFFFPNISFQLSL